MAFKPTQLLAAAMLLSMAVAAMAGRQDAPQAELEAKKKYGHKDDYHKEEYHAKEEYHPKEYYPPAGEYYPPTGEHYPKPHEYYPSPAYPPHYGPTPPPYYPPSHDYYPKAPVCPDCPTGLTRCPATGTPFECVDLSRNIRNCGACGRVCGDNQVCTATGCACATGFINCGTGTTLNCVDPLTNQLNCGGCGNPDTGANICLEDEVCDAGECDACGEDQLTCTTCTDNGLDVTCEDPTADTTCGDCFIDCTEFGEVCGPEETCVDPEDDCAGEGDKCRDEPCCEGFKCCQPGGGNSARCVANEETCPGGGKVVQPTRKAPMPSWARRPTAQNAKHKRTRKAAKKAAKKAGVKTGKKASEKAADKKPAV